jgi:hypothetical protein
LEFCNEVISDDSKIVVRYKVHYFFLWYSSWYVTIMELTLSVLDIIAPLFVSFSIIWFVFLFSFLVCIVLYVFPFFFVACIVVLYYLQLGDVCSLIHVVGN